MRFPDRATLYTVGTALAVAVAIFGAALVVNYLRIRYGTQSTPAGEVLLPVSTAAPLPASAPVRLRIPEINVDAPFVSLGQNADGTVQVPTSTETVGWYRGRPTPGEVGPAIVLGHVDSYRGPAVFFSLGQLKPGDEVSIDRADGSTATFRVDKLERHPQDEFPTNAVYGDLPYPDLRLITCTGTYDRGSERYSSNLIVFASLVDEQSSATSTSS